MSFRKDAADLVSEINERIYSEQLESIIKKHSNEQLTKEIVQFIKSHPGSEKISITADKFIS